MAGTEDLQTLRDATAAMAAIADRLASQEPASLAQVADLRSHFDKEFQRLETQMGTMNAHLDNIAREVSMANAHHDMTNKLLEEDLQDRKDERRRRLELEQVEREHTRELEQVEREHSRAMQVDELKDKREVRGIAVGAGKEAWAILRVPLGYLIAAALGYAAWYFFGTTPSQQGSAVEHTAPQHQVGADD